jgi:rod shape-determining protein MreC
MNRQKVNVDVIGVSQLDGNLIIDGGSELGLHQDLPVINGDGLVGIIRSVSKGEAQVALLTGFGVKVGGIDSTRHPPEAGLVSGNGTSTLTMLTYSPKAVVESGDKIYTSGQSKNIPANLLIGEVIGVDEDMYSGTRRLTIFPAITLGLMHEVQVLK